MAGLGVAPAANDGVARLEMVGAKPDGEIVSAVEYEGVAMVKEEEEEGVLTPPCDTLVVTVEEGGSTTEKVGEEVGLSGVEVGVKDGLGARVRLAVLLDDTLSLEDAEGE